ncbi:MAG: hypothetical protein AB7H77_06160 [Bdellovibrionales bacterium]
MQHNTEKEDRLNFWKRCRQQPDVEILPPESGYNTAYTTAASPNGISEMIRRLAFRYSNNPAAQQRLLSLADKVNTMEGLMQNMGRGYVPNALAQFGMSAAMKHVPKRLVFKFGLAAVGIYAAAAYVRHRRRKRA